MKSHTHQESMKPPTDADCGSSTFDQLRNVAVDLVKQDGRQSIREKVAYTLHVESF